MPDPTAPVPPPMSRIEADPGIDSLISRYSAFIDPAILRHIYAWVSKIISLAPPATEQYPQGFVLKIRAVVPDCDPPDSVATLAFAAIGVRVGPISEDEPRARIIAAGRFDLLDEDDVLQVDRLRGWELEELREGGGAEVCVGFGW